MWKFNEGILNNKGLVNELTRELNRYIEESDNWEVDSTVIRGEES